MFEADGPLVARYIAFEHLPSLGRRTFVQVANESESWRGEIEVAGAAGVHVVDIGVAPYTATLFGKVVDVDRQPVERTSSRCMGRIAPASRACTRSRRTTLVGGSCTTSSRE